MRAPPGSRSGPGCRPSRYRRASSTAAPRPSSGRSARCSASPSLGVAAMVVRAEEFVGEAHRAAPERKSPARDAPVQARRRRRSGCCGCLRRPATDRRSRPTRARHGVPDEAEPARQTRRGSRTENRSRATPARRARRRSARMSARARLARWRVGGFSTASRRRGPRWQIQMLSRPVFGSVRRAPVDDHVMVEQRRHRPVSRARG